MERAPKAPFSKSIRSLAAKILAVKKEKCPIPTPMNDKQFYGGW